MKLHLLVGQRVEDYSGQYGPEVLDCWGEYDVESNPEGFEEALRRFRGEKHFSEVRELIVQVDDEVFTRLFKPAVVTAYAAFVEK